jgi:hypothetical protein
MGVRRIPHGYRCDPGEEMSSKTLITALRERAGSRVWLGRYAVLIPMLPILASWLYWFFNRNYWFTIDPAAWYFMDSLAIFKGSSYVYVDHPGTPVHVLGSILLGLTYPFLGGREAFIRYHLANPETFFTLANVLLIAGNIATIYVFYRTISAALKQDRILAGTALSLMYFGVHPSGFDTLTYWSHNSFNFVFGTLWLLWLYQELQTGSDVRQRKIFLLGLTAGAMATTQLYMLSWLVGGLITLFVYTLRRHKTVGQAIGNSLLMSGSGLLGILIMLVPVYRELPRFFGWLSRLIGRRGLYGAGEEGIYSPNLISTSLVYWSHKIPLVMLALLLVLIIFGGIAWFSKSRDLTAMPAGDLALVIGLLAQTLLLLLMMSKMYYRLIYVLSVTAILPVLFLLAMKHLEQLERRDKILKRAFYIGLIASTIFFMLREMRLQQPRVRVESEVQAATSQVIAQLAEAKGVPEEQIAVVYTVSTPLKCAGLIMANNWIRAFDNELQDQCPNQSAVYDYAYDTRMNLPQPVRPIEEIHWDLVVWPDNGSDVLQYLDAVGAKNIPRSWHVKRAKWFFIHPDAIQGNN